MSLRSFIALTTAPAALLIAANLCQADDWREDRLDRRHRVDYDDLADREEERLEEEVERREEMLERRYEQQREWLEDAYDRAKIDARGHHRAELARQYHADRRVLEKQYRAEKERLDEHEDVMEDAIEDYYDDLEDGRWTRGRHGVREYHFGPWHGWPMLRIPRPPAPRRAVPVPHGSVYPDEPPSPHRGRHRVPHKAKPSPPCDQPPGHDRHQGVWF